VRFAIVGTGFWARYQLAAWQEVEGAECVALCDRDQERAAALAKERGVPAVYDDLERMLEQERPAFLDVITPPDAHVPCVEAALARGIPAITQKPMAPSLAAAEALVARARQAGVPFLVHENWRWQAPLRAVRDLLASGTIGAPFRARITMVSGFPVFVNQPTLKDQTHFVLADMGSHILDLARFYFGEADRLYAQIHQVHADIKGDDIATVMLRMSDPQRRASGGRPAPVTVTCEMGFAENALEQDCFPETFVFVEGERGSIELGPHFWLRVTTADGTHARRVRPPRYGWADPDYDVAHASMVPCNANLLQGLGGGPVETTAEDNLKTLRLVYAAYDSARTGQAAAV
jgi:predicted dehydrogenase